MEDTYVYVAVKLYLKSGQTEDSIHEVVQDMDYSFVHPSITDHEIKDIIDMQLPDVSQVDMFDDMSIALPIGNALPTDIGGMFENASGMPEFVDPFDLTPFDGE